MCITKAGVFTQTRNGKTPRLSLGKEGERLSKLVHSWWGESHERIALNVKGGIHRFLWMKRSWAALTHLHVRKGRRAWMLRGCSLCPRTSFTQHVSHLKPPPRYACYTIYLTPTKGWEQYGKERKTIKCDEAAICGLLGSCFMKQIMPCGSFSMMCMPVIKCFYYLYGQEVWDFTI